MKVEYWVVRVICAQRKDGRRVPLQYDRHVVAADGDAPEVEDAKKVVRAKIASDDWCVLPSDGIIAEPVKPFATQGAADAHAQVLAAKHPGEEFRVCINADL